MRFRKSLKIAPGVRATVSKTGFGVSSGVRGARYSVHSSGRRTTSVGIPGSGVSHVSTSTGGSRRATGGTPAPTGGRYVQTVSGANAAAYLPKPGMFSGKTDKRYYEGVQAYFADDQARALAAFAEVLASEADTPSAHLVSALCVGSTGGDDAEQIRHLEAVATSEGGMPDRLQLKYLPPGLVTLGLTVKVTENISAQAPFDPVGATLMLAELYQQAGRLEEAIGLVQQMNEANPTDPTIRLSLADLLMADEDYEGVVEVARGVTNTDDVGVAILHLKGAALTALGHQTAGLEALRDALAKTSGRDAELLKVVRYDRALAYEAAGQHGRAKQDWERIYAQDPNYEDVRARLASAASG